MSNRTPALLLAVCLAAPAACTRAPTEFSVTSYVQPDAPEVFTERFPDGVFRLDGMRNVHIAFEIPATAVRVQRPPDTATAPADEPDAGNDDAADEVWMSQIILIEVLWRPRPGKTFAERTQSNASIVYCLITGQSAVSYEGSGFVYFSEEDDGATIEGRIESSTLYPVRFIGEPNDLFGPCHMVGTFTARQSGTAVTDVQQRARRLLSRHDAAPAAN